MSGKKLKKVKEFGGAKFHYCVEDIEEAGKTLIQVTVTADNEDLDVETTYESHFIFNGDHYVVHTNQPEVPLANIFDFVSPRIVAGDDKIFINDLELKKLADTRIVVIGSDSLLINPNSELMRMFEKQEFVLENCDADLEALGFTASTESQCLEKAIKLATSVHEHQIDKAGKPYILHPLRVMRGMGEDMVLMTIAVLHDVVEDSALTSEDIYGVFGSRVGEAVECLTRKMDESWLEYIDRIKNNEDAVRVKIVDLIDNANVLRLPTFDKDAARRTKKYVRTYNELRDVLKTFDDTRPPTTDENTGVLSTNTWAIVKGVIVTNEGDPFKTLELGDAGGHLHVYYRYLTHFFKDNMIHVIFENEAPGVGHRTVVHKWACRASERISYAYRLKDGEKSRIAFDPAPVAKTETWKIVAAILWHYEGRDDLRLELRSGDGRLFIFTDYVSHYFKNDEIHVKFMGATDSDSEPEEQSAVYSWGETPREVIHTTHISTGVQNG